MKNRRHTDKQHPTNLDALKAMRKGGREAQQEQLGPGFHSFSHVHISKKTYTRKAKHKGFPSMRMLVGALLCLFLFCLASCERESDVSVRMIEADQLLLAHPDSALTLLKGMKGDVQQADEWTRQRYKLLLLKAWNKVGSPLDRPVFPHMDSIVFDLVDYMEQSPDQSLLPQTYFQAGRLFSEEGRHEKALLYYKMAQLCDSAYVDDYLMSRILAQTGYIYLRFGMLEEASDMQETAREYCKKAGDTLGVRYCTEDIATIAQMLDTFHVDPAKLVNNRYTVRAVNDKARYYMLKHKSDYDAQSTGDSGILVIEWIFLLIIASSCAYLLYRRFTPRDLQATLAPDIASSEADATDSNGHAATHPHPEPLPKHRFYDADISDLLSERLKVDKPLRQADWQLLEMRLLETFPTFRTTLYALFNLSETEYRISMLIKMDLFPSQIARLMAIGNSTVSQSRLRMAQKAGVGEGTAKDWDSEVLSIPPSPES